VVADLARIEHRVRTWPRKARRRALRAIDAVREARRWTPARLPGLAVWYDAADDCVSAMPSRTAVVAGIAMDDAPKGDRVHVAIGGMHGR